MTKRVFPSAAEAVKYLKKADSNADAYPFFLVGRFKSYEVHGIFIPGGSFVETINSQKDVVSVCRFLNDTAFRRSEQGKNINAYSEIEVDSAVSTAVSVQHI